MSVSAPYETPQERFRWLLKSSWRITAVAGLVILLYSAAYLPNWRTCILVVTTALLAALASSMAAALVGFLFGIPRVLQQVSQAGSESQADDFNEATIVGRGRTSKSSYVVNTNLEQISDWLTKIIVGVGLIELSRIADGFSRLVGSLRVGFGDQPGSDLVAGAVLIFFSAWGFMFGYLLTRTYLTLAFRAFDVDEVAAIAVDRAVNETERRGLQQEEYDALALKLVSRQLYNDGETVSIDELRKAFAKVSAPVKEQIIALARTQRQNNWEWERISDPERKLKSSLAHSRVIPIFEALVDVDNDDPQVHAELGYALKDDQHANNERAREELTTSISLAAKANAPTDWMEMNRAIVGIRLGVAAEQIRSDIEGAMDGSTRVKQIVSRHSEIQGWLAQAKATR